MTTDNKDEKALLKPYNFDGIQELDNPPPPWIMWVLYITIFWAALYMVHYHAFDQGVLQDEEYQQEMAAAEAAKTQQKKQPTEAMPLEEQIAEGKQLFVDKTCVTCHGNAGQGNQIGPNLTDNYWIHGNTDEDMFQVIKFGMPTKGMTPYKDQLTDAKIQSLVAYIQNELVGSNPPNAKEPQGDAY